MGLDSVPAGKQSFGDVGLANEVFDFSRNTTNNYVEKSAVNIEQGSRVDQKGESASSQGGSWTDAAGTGLFIFGQTNTGAGKLTNAFQASNKGVLRAAVNNDLPTGNIKGIMRSTSKFANGVKWAGIAGNSAGVILTGINIYNDGWTAGNTVDLIFNGAAFIPGYGWAISTGYSGVKWYVNSIQEEIRTAPDGGARVIERLEFMNSGMPGMQCFAAGTQVLMGDLRYKTIELVQVGDSVLTYNFESKVLEVNPVLHIDAPVHHKLIKVVFSNGEEITSTEDHPYYVNKKGWCSFNPQQTMKNYGIETGQLEVSDFCFMFKNSKLKKVKVVQIVPFEESIKTYNLTKIANSDNYFVNGILVNNESKVE